jgi:hypothetical protein
MSAILIDIERSDDEARAMAGVLRAESIDAV